MGDFNFPLNPVSAILIVPVVLIFISALITPFSKEGIIRGFYSIVNNLEFIIALLISLYLTKGIFFDRSNKFFVFVHDLLPEAIKASLAVNNIYTFVCAAFIILIIVVMLVRLITYPLYSNLFERIAFAIYRFMNSLGGITKRIISLICSIPRALVTILLISFIFYFMSYYFTIPGLNKWINESKVLNTVYETALKPVIESNIAQKIPVILNDQFSSLGKGTKNENEQKIAENIKDTLGKYNIKVIEYFNGVTLDQAIKSNVEINKLARNLVKNENDDYNKAKILYTWISKNIKYDYAKAREIGKKIEGIESGSISCFNSREGICFDYASLFISMCKEIGIKVRLVTGLGYSGLAWGDHAWNQFYYSDENRWVNVDCTFGVNGNYFDTKRFSMDHKNDEVQGEW